MNFNTKDFNEKIVNSIANPGAKIIKLAEILMIINVYATVIAGALWIIVGLFVCGSRYGFAFGLYVGVLLGLVAGLVASYFGCLTLRAFGEVVHCTRKISDATNGVASEVVVPEELKF